MIPLRPHITQRKSPLTFVSWIVGIMDTVQKVCQTFISLNKQNTSFKISIFIQRMFHCFFIDISITVFINSFWNSDLLVFKTFSLLKVKLNLWGVFGFYIGVCRCDDGWSGTRCDIHKSTRPFVMETLFNGTSCDTCGCDTQQTEDCSTATIYGANFVDSSTLTCHYKFVKVRSFALF